MKIVFGFIKQNQPKLSLLFKEHEYSQGWAGAFSNYFSAQDCHSKNAYKFKGIELWEEITTGNKGGKNDQR